MKSFISSLNFPQRALTLPLPLCALLLAMFFIHILQTNSHAQSEFVEARVVSAKKRAEVFSNGRKKTTLARGDLLSPGDVIDTRNGGRVVIQLSDGSEVIVHPRSRVVLKDYRAASSARELLQIVVGRVRARVKKIGGKPNPYRISTPTASIAVRGTKFSIKVKRDGDTRVVVYEGLVAVDNTTDTFGEVLVEPGQGVEVEEDEGIEFFTPESGSEEKADKGCVACEDDDQSDDQTNEDDLIDETPPSSDYGDEQPPQGFAALPTVGRKILGTAAFGSVSEPSITQRANSSEEVEPLAGWFSVFPDLQGYSRKFHSPKVSADKKAYRQTVTYTWMGGRYEIIEATLAHDPAFKRKFTAEVRRDKVKPPEKIRVGKRSGWLWTSENETERNLERICCRLVIPLAAGKVLLLEGRGEVMSLTALAERFDLLRASAALDAPPRTDFRRTLDAFRDLRKGVSYAEVVDWVGFADQDLGSGIHVMAYNLPDGSRVLLGFADFNNLMYAKYEPKSGKVSDLIK